MLKYPMLTIKQAAVALDLDEHSVRERLIKGQLRGEKRRSGFRDKWFVFRGAVEAELEKKRELESGQEEMCFEPTLNDQPITIEAELVEEMLDEAESKPRGRDPIELSAIAEQLMRPLVEKISQQAQSLAVQEHTIEEQKRRLRLLPDLQREADEFKTLAESKTFEANALSTQVTALKAQLQHAQEKSAQEVLALEKAMAEHRSKEAESVSTALAELARLQDQKEATILEQLNAVQLELNKLKEPPWWKKFLGLA
jgi:chemotaxis protein histidine kinase CheA